MFHRFTLTNTDAGLDFDIELDPDRRLYCFIGENAVGKTALLESLGQVIWWLHAIWWNEAAKGQRLGGFRNNAAFRSRFDAIELRVPDGTFGGIDVKRNDNWGIARPLDAFTAPPPSALVVNQPFVFISSQQRTTLANIGPEALALVGDQFSALLDTIERGIGATRRAPASTTAFATWLASRLLVNPRFVVGMRNPHAEVADLLRLLLRFDPVSFAGILNEQSGPSRIGIAYKAPQLLLLDRPVDRLASGWNALLRIFQEIVSSIAAWEAVRGSTDILGSDALVFIDEIDAHLHPKWQRNLLPFLKQNFPNATFVVTTHSPLMVRDTEPGEAYELQRTDRRVTARRLGSPRDWYLSDLFAEAFHVELPGPGEQAGEGQRPLSDVLLEFAHAVQAFGATRDPDTQSRALALYAEARSRLLDDDPRGQTLEQLRRLLP